jgi:hypothetical protein
MGNREHRSNREFRKPKQERAKRQPESKVGNQIKLAANTNTTRSKG